MCGNQEGSFSRHSPASLQRSDNLRYPWDIARRGQPDSVIAESTQQKWKRGEGLLNINALRTQI